MKQSGARLLFKQVIDRTVALGALAATAPLSLAAAVAVRATMGSPVLFTQERPGFRGKPFRIYKMRTMTDARGPGGELLSDAERLTPLGRALRASSVDELPQLLNVLRGELSLVGPRPLLTEYLPLYSTEQARRHDVMPGITGWAQIHGRNALTWPQKFALDVWYVDNWSIALDLRILAATAWKVLRREGVANDGHVTMPRFRGAADANGAGSGTSPPARSPA